MRVQVILEGDYLVEQARGGGPVSLRVASTRTTGCIHAALLRAGVDVITDLNPEIFHQKFVVRDPGSDTAAVLTGSTNFTLYRHRHEPARQRRAARATTSTMSWCCTGRPTAGLVPGGVRAAAVGHVRGAARAATRPARAEFRLGQVRVKPLFAPRHGPEMEIMKQMLKARERHRLRDVHLRAVLGHRRHHGPAGRARPGHPRGARPRPGRAAVGRHPAAEARGCASCSRTSRAPGCARCTTS